MTRSCIRRGVPAPGPPTPTNIPHGYRHTERVDVKYYLDGDEITEQQALDMEAAGEAHVSYGSSGANTPDGSGEPWIRMAHGPNRNLT